MADSLCSLMSFDDRLPSLGQDRVAVFYEVGYVPEMLARLNGSCSPELRKAFEDGYSFKIIIGKKCENCRPIWVLGKTWEEQPDDKGMLRDHLCDVYLVQIESMRDGTGFVDRGIVTNPDKPEEVQFAGPPGYVRLPERVANLVRGNLSFFRKEPGFLPPFIQDPTLLQALEASAPHRD